MQARGRSLMTTSSAARQRSAICMQFSRFSDHLQSPLHQSAAMRDSRQSAAGPLALFAGVSQKLDDARGLIDSAVPHVRCANGLTSSSRSINSTESSECSSFVRLFA